MSQAAASASQQQAPPEPPIVAIRAKPPSPRRLSRKVLLAATLAAGAVVAFALVNGLSERPNRHSAQQQETAAAGGPPESIRGASDQYGATDLEGGHDLTLGDADLVATENELQPPRDPAWANSAPPSGSASTSAPAQADPQTVARTSAILFTHANAEGDNARDDADARLNARLVPPGSRYEIKAGDVIPTALVTALNSDLPGRIIAQVTAPVYDTVTGQHLLIPQGSRLIGTCENGTRYGDRRLLLVWNRLILPNGWSINLQQMNATDPSGAAGLTDQTDNHLGRLGVAIGLSAIISVVANEAEGDQDQGSLSQSVGDAAAQQAAQTGSRLVDRELEVHPTLRVRAGAPVRVLVTRDIELRPYTGPRRP